MLSCVPTPCQMFIVCLCSTSNISSFRKINDKIERIDGYDASYDVTVEFVNNNDTAALFSLVVNTSN